MKTLSTIVLAAMITAAAFGQEITGQWNGMLKIQAGMQLRVVFHIAKSGAGYSATMDSPDQGAKNIPVTTTTFENRTLKLTCTNLLMEYIGKLQGDSIIGTFKQGGQPLPLNLSKNANEKPAVHRPQEPAKPYPYYSEEVSIRNGKAGITLAGTLTLPKKEGIYPVVVLITGSGPQNRDEEVFGHKPFLILSDYLTRNGIAVLRYDDRGVAHSTGNFQTAVTTDFASDVESAIAYLKTRKEINKKKIGLIGHSEGGIIAPMVAAETKDVRFIVLLAGTGVRGDQLLLSQQELIARASGMPEAKIEESLKTNREMMERVLNPANPQKLKSDLTLILTEALKQESDTTRQKKLATEAYIMQQVNQITSPWWQFFIKYDPVPALMKVKCPVLALNGEKDLQVPAKENIAAIESTLKKGGNRQVTTKVFPNMNHLFQECKTGAPSEYSTIEQTFSPSLLNEIARWIKLTTK